MCRKALWKLPRANEPAVFCLSGFVCVVLAHEAWVWGIGFDKDASWETPPARAPASTQLIVLRSWVRLPYLTGGRPNLWVPHLSSLRQSPTPMPAAKIFSICLIDIGTLVITSLFYRYIQRHIDKAKHQRTSWLLQPAWLVSYTFVEKLSNWLTGKTNNTSAGVNFRPLLVRMIW